MTCAKHPVLFCARAKGKHFLRVHHGFVLFFLGFTVVKRKQDEGRLKSAGTGNKNQAKKEFCQAQCTPCLKILKNKSRTVLSIHERHLY